MIRFMLLEGGVDENFINGDLPFNNNLKIGLPKALNGRSVQLENKNHQLN